MAEVDDPDGIGWNYRIYRSNTGGEFIADAGKGSLADSATTERPRMVKFRFQRNGFIVTHDGDEVMRISRDALLAMAHIEKERGGLKQGGRI